MKRQARWINVLMIVALSMAWPGNVVMAQTPVGPEFTYQGRLLDSSNIPINGLCDMSFALYDEESGGAQIGATQTITDVVMSDGYFSAALDFGAPAWNGDTRWLQVEATCPPGGSLTGFPRQVVSAVPYALYALSGNMITSTVYYTPSYHLQGWETITGTPGTYTPTAHVQDWGTITGQPAEYTPTAHVQDWGTITGQPAEYTPTAHVQDWGTITGQPAEYTPTLHDMITAHTYNGGAALDLFGLSAASTITRITPSSNPGATANILASNSTGGLTLAGKLSYNESDWTGGNVIYVPVGASIQDYINAAENGDTLILGSGQYIVTGTITINKQLNIMGQGNAGFLTTPVSAGHGTLISSAMPSIVAFQIDHDNVRVAHLSINLTGGSSSIGVNIGNSPVGTGLVGIVLTNIDVIVSGSGWSQGFTVYASDVIMRNLTFYISSTNDAASGFWLWNDSNTTRNAVVDAYNITGIAKGNTTYAYGFVSENINDANTLTMNIENSSVRVLAGTPLDIAIASISTQTGLPVTNNSTINAFLCTLDGDDYDAQQNGSNVLALGGSVIVNNRVSGIVTYRATMAAGTGVFGGTLTTASGSITDSSRLISFGNNDLTTTGLFTHTQAWTTITGTPSTYTPTTHLQGWNTITGTPSTYTTSLISTYIGYGSANNTLTGSVNATLNASGTAYFANVGIGTVSPSAKLDISTNSDMSELLRFSTDRTWSFLQLGTGSATSLGLRSNSTLKYFRILGNDNSTTASFLNVEATPANSRILLLPNGGHVGIGTGSASTFTLQIDGDIGPNVANTYDLGSASFYWATIHYHTLTSHSLSVFSTTVTLQNGKEVSCLDALKEIKGDPSKKVKGMAHMDYATIPSIALNSAPITFDISTYTIKKDGEDGADLDMMVSLVLCAEKELDAKIIALDDRMSDFERRIANLEQGVR